MIKTPFKDGHKGQHEEPEIQESSRSSQTSRKFPGSLGTERRAHPPREARMSSWDYPASRRRLV